MGSSSNLYERVVSQEDPVSFMKLEIHKLKITKQFSEEKSLSKELSFQKHFPELFSYLQNFSLKFRSKLADIKHSDLGDLEESCQNLIKSELEGFEKEFSPFIEEWRKLAQYQNQKTQIHTILCLILIHIETEELIKNSLLSKYDQNILLYALLFHDISKHQALNPLLEEKFADKGKDKLHPFKSAATALKIFQRMGFFSNENETLSEQLIDHIYELFIKACIDDSSIFKKGKRYAPDFTKFDEIHSKLLELRKLSECHCWIYDVVILIALHQSLPVSKIYSPFISPNQISSIFDRRLMELMRILMINDSASHSLFKGKSWAKKINDRIDDIHLIV